MYSLDTLLSQSVVPCLVLTTDSRPAYRFLRRHDEDPVPNFQGHSGQ